MTTAIIGIGNIGGSLARHLVRSGEPVVLAAKDEANAAALAHELGEHARAGSVEEAIAEADAVVFAVWLDTIKELISKDKDLLEGKVIVDPSNPIGVDENGETIRTLPDGQCRSMEHLWSRADANERKPRRIGRPRKRPRQAKTAAFDCR